MMGWPKGKPRKAVVHEDAPIDVNEPMELVETCELSVDKPVLSMTAEEVTAHAMASEPDQVGYALYQVAVPPTCAICRFWRPTGELNHGQCRRFPAHPRNNSPYASWPVMPATDWCGEFQASFQHFKAKV